MRNATHRNGANTVDHLRSGKVQDGTGIWERSPKTAGNASSAKHADPMLKRSQAQFDRYASILFGAALSSNEAHVRFTACHALCASKSPDWTGPKWI